MNSFLKILLFLLVAVAANATTYYVTTTGSDANPGTMGSPWLTVQKAANTMIAGDVANVATGTYNETVTTGAAGSAGNYIRFVGTSLPTIKGFIFNHAYNEANGFLVTGAGLSYAYEIKLAGANTKIIGNTFTNTPGRAVSHNPTGPYASNAWVEANRFDQFNGVGVAFGGTGHTFTNNWMTSSTGFDAMNVLAQNVTIVANTFTNVTRPPGSLAHTDIIQVFNYAATPGVYTNVIFERNLVINSECQIGNVEDQENLGNVNHWIFRNNLYVNVGAAIQIYAPHFYWYNNTFYRCAQNTGGPVLFRSGGAGKGDGTFGDMRNNIFFECGSNPGSTVGGYYGVENSVSNNFVGNYNLVVGTGAGTTKTGFATYGREANSINGSNPLFVNGASDWHLQTNSPCISAGATLSGFTNDYADGTRTVPWTIGAYLFASGGDTNPPTAPTSLTASAIHSNGATLTWSPGTDDVGVVSYDVYQNSVNVRNVTTTNTTFSALSPSTAYSYVVRAVDAAGNQSPDSNTAAFTTPGTGGIPPNAALLLRFR